MTLPNLESVKQARRRLSRFLGPSPLVESSTGFLKLENLQPTGAFKVRGALNALSLQVERGDRRPVMAASAGNHARGVAYAARLLKLEAHLLVPRNAPKVKVDGCRAAGAHVECHGETFDEADQEARAVARRLGYRYLPAFDDPDVIAGQGTIGLELLPFAPDVVYVPIGGGSLISGMALVLKSHGVNVIGVQVEGVDAMRRQLAGEPARSPCATVADGLRVAVPGELTRVLCEQLVDEIVTVTEDEVHEAMHSLLTQERLVAEGAGAVAYAVMKRDKRRRGRKVAIISGGNVDPVTLEKSLQVTGGR